MWGRVVEIMTAVWIAMSPWIFRASGDSTLLWGDQVAALAISLFAGLSFWKPTQHAHLVTLLVATILILWGRLSGSPPSPAHQNHICVGLFLYLIAIIPNNASEPTEGWLAEVEPKSS